MQKTPLGLRENVAGLLCYALGWLSGLIFILIEPENRFVRFHATQSMIVFSGLTLIILGLSMIPSIGLFLIELISAFGLGLWLALMVKAYQGTMYKLPWVGNQAEKWLEQQNR